MNFKNTKVMNFEGAFRGMRNPKNSWSKSDSYFNLVNICYDEKDWDIAQDWLYKKYPDEDYEDLYENHSKEMDGIDQWLLGNGVLQEDYNNDVAEVAFIGPNDMDLAQRLIKAGPEHRKFLRQIFVCVDITAPLYW